jgi:hypothetical protein
MDQQVFHRGESLAILPEWYNTCSVEVRPAHHAVDAARDLSAAGETSTLPQFPAVSQRGGVS